ncbi:hypothetical protein D9M68_996920 [compost metagenome]
MKDTMRNSPPRSASSTKNSFSTTTPSSAAPAIHKVRTRRPWPSTIATTPQIAQVIDSAACVSQEA